MYNLPINILSTSTTQTLATGTTETLTVYDLNLDVSFVMIPLAIIIFILTINFFVNVTSK